MSTGRKKILYGLQGDGRGHLSRAEVLIRQISKRHDVLIFTSPSGEEKIFPELKTLPGVSVSGEIFSPKLYFGKNKVNIFKTARTGLIDFFRSGIASLARGLRVYAAFRPDIIISDLEPCSARLAFLTGTPFLTLDHQHILTNCRLQHRPELRRDYFLARFMVKWLIPLSKLNIITTFFFPPVKRNGTYLFPPLIRRQILGSRKKVSEGDFTLVYHTTPSAFAMIDRGLKEASPEKFVVYNMGRQYRDGNIIYRRVSEKQFIDDLRSCKAVICNGGHTLICESIFMGKPILSIPLSNNFEQIINSLYLQQLGYGRYCGEFSGEAIKSFLKNYQRFRSEVKGIDFCGNKEITQFVLNLIESSGIPS